MIKVLGSGLTANGAAVALRDSKILYVGLVSLYLR